MTYSTAYPLGPAADLLAPDPLCTSVNLSA
jgi:hypothetical protein